MSQKNISHKIFFIVRLLHIAVFLFFKKIINMALRRMLVLNKSARCARRDKHTPCIKTNRLKRQNHTRAERAVRSKPLGESGPFFSHIGNAIFFLLFIDGFFLSSCEICFCLFVVAIPARVYLNMHFFIQISTQYSLFSQKFPLKLDFMYSRSKTILC